MSEKNPSTSSAASHCNCGWKKTPYQHQRWMKKQQSASATVDYVNRKERAIKKYINIPFKSVHVLYMCYLMHTLSNINPHFTDHSFVTILSSECALQFLHYDTKHTDYTLMDEASGICSYTWSTHTLIHIPVTQKATRNGRSVGRSVARSLARSLSFDRVEVLVFDVAK